MIDNKVFFSVVIPSYNRLEELQYCLRSLEKQTYKYFEVIVIDDCSPSDISSFVDTDTFSFEINVYRNKENMGAAVSRNVGIDNAKYDWIAFLDDDDLWDNNKLFEISNEIIKNPEVNFIYHNAEVVMVNENSSYVTNKINPVNYFESMLIKNVIGGTPMVIVKKELFDKYGKFDNSIKSLEDYELWLRLSKHFESLFVDKALSICNYYTERSSVSKNIESNLNSIAYINQKYKSDYDNLNKYQLSQKFEWEHSMIAHKFLLNYNRISATKYYLKAFLIRYKVKFLVASILSLIYPKLLFKLR